MDEALQEPAACLVPYSLSHTGGAALPASIPTTRQSQGVFVCVCVCLCLYVHMKAYTSGLTNALENMQIFSFYILIKTSNKHLMCADI